MSLRVQLLRDRRRGDGGRQTLRPDGGGVQGVVRHSHHATSQSEFRTEMDMIFIQFPMKNLLVSHDLVARRDYLPRLPETFDDVDEDDGETVKMVQLVKSHEPMVSHRGKMID